MEHFILEQAQAKRERLRAEAQHETLLQEAKKTRAGQGHNLSLALWLTSQQKYYWLGLLILLALLLGFSGTMA
ncbi:MAG: hypothetical protein KJ077_49340 [Anaerolineae bacterium]|nr:hypothetical protein [Anaerolineae bacterium]